MFCLEIWAEIIFGWPIFKIIFDIPIFLSFKGQIKNQASDYRLLKVSNYIYYRSMNIESFINISN